MSFRYNIKNDRNIKTYIYFRPTENAELDDIKLILEDDERFDVFTNNDDVNPHNSYKNITNYIYRIITKTGFLCKGLNPEYILDAFEECDAVVVIGSSANILPNGNIFGFALINFEEYTNSLYIDIICSHTGIQGAGDILINAMQEISRKLLITEISLKSVKSAIPFYEKYGFIKFDKLCDNMCVMFKTIAPSHRDGLARGRTKSLIKKILGKRKTKKTRKIRKTRKTGKSRKHYLK